MKDRFKNHPGQMPFVRLLLPFMVGIIVELIFAPERRVVLCMAALFSGLFIIHFKLSGIKRFQFEPISGVLVLFLVFISGILLTQVKAPELYPYYGEVVVGEGIVAEELIEKENVLQTTLRIESIKNDDSIVDLKTEVLVYFEKSDSMPYLSYGDRILFLARVEEIKNRGNPGEFDYKVFMYHKGITGQVYLEEDNYKVISRNQGKRIRAFAYQARNKLANIYQQNGIDGQEFAVLQALTLGDRSEIDIHTKQSYMYSGATHILAVSGLHVGILYILFATFLKFLDRLKSRRFNYGKALRISLIIILLWSFALLAGLHPSVKRAALMFTFVLIGQAGKRYVNIYNSIAVSAFILLLIDPYEICNVGFQLSYSAVLSIVYFQPLIMKIFTFKAKTAYYMWSLISVSIAAQIGTFPLTLYYFHIFPNFFIVTNLIVIPLATGILYVSFFLFIFSFSPLLSHYLGIILKYLVKVLNTSTGFVEDLPLSYIEHISFTWADMLFSYILIIGFSYFVLHRTIGSIRVLIITLSLWLIISTVQKVEQLDRKEMIVYNIRGQSVVNFIGGDNYVFGDSNFNEYKHFTYSILPYWIEKGKTNYHFFKAGNSKFENDEISISNEYVSFGGKRIVLINDKRFNDLQSEKRLKTDFLILSGESVRDIKALNRIFEIGCLIIDSSNGYYYTKAIENECSEIGIECYSVLKTGAYHIILVK